MDLVIRSTYFDLSYRTARRLKWNFQKELEFITGKRFMYCAAYTRQVALNSCESGQGMGKFTARLQSKCCAFAHATLLKSERGQGSVSSARLFSDISAWPDIQITFRHWFLSDYLIPVFCEEAHIQPTNFLHRTVTTDRRILTHKSEPGRQCTYNVTMRRVSVTTAAVEKQ